MIHPPPLPMVCLVGRTGSGKSRLARALADMGGFEETVSVTSRPPRPGEVDGRDYHFVSPAAFNAMEGTDALVESAAFSGRHYGTPAHEITRIHASGQVPVLVVEPSGAAAVRQWAASRGCPAAVVYLDCPTSLSAERMASRFLSECRLRPAGHPLALRALADTYAGRFEAILGVEQAWENVMDYDLYLPVQQTDADTRTTQAAVQALVDRLTSTPATAVSKDEYRGGLAKSAQDQVDRTLAQRVRQALELVTLAGEPYPPASMLGRWLTDPSSLPDVSRAEFEQGIARADAQEVQSALTGGGRHSVLGGLLALCRQAPGTDYWGPLLTSASPDALQAFLGGARDRDGRSLGARVLALREPSGNSPAKALAQALSPERFVGLAVPAGFDPNAPVNRPGQTLLHLAACVQDAAAIDALVTAGARADMPDVDHCTPADLARRWGSEKLLARALARAGRSSAPSPAPA